MSLQKLINFVVMSTETATLGGSKKGNGGVSERGCGKARFSGDPGDAASVHSLLGYASHGHLGEFWGVGRGGAGGVSMDLTRNKPSLSRASLARHTGWPEMMSSFGALHATNILHSICREIPPGSTGRRQV